MATLIGNLFSSPFLPSQLGNSRPHKFKLKPCTPPILKRSFTATNVRASSSTSLVDTTPTFELAKDFLKPVYGGSIIDTSCGSGLFSRLFARSGLFSLVVALDYSENMLQQNIVLVRADISRPPFATSSADAVHAVYSVSNLAAMVLKVADISRVLRPGGNISHMTGSQQFVSDGKLEDLCNECGLVSFTSVRNRAFVMISATKPN
ncbi:Hypothetical predicted protein [Prunus dulcis]|uniref:Methyltransferase type 11 domain-containing protein n=1 Tax=Prunus dulcis TaxID=3755 RepID=A0A5E4EDP5_PRUDU|nr:hypothetical protein L3X38_008439 [Prunus dulcis]VVA13794.1 Hypothetical predicted protein [Prunus dulcis]